MLRLVRLTPTQPYAANGIAQVTIYIHSSDFDTMEDNAEVPERCCDPVGQSQTVAYTSTSLVRSRRTPHACVPTPELTCDYSTARLFPEDFEMSQQAQSWFFVATDTEVGSSLRTKMHSLEVSKTSRSQWTHPKSPLEFDFTKKKCDDSEIG
jgi:uncharacterized protein YchJ